MLEYHLFLIVLVGLDLLLFLALPIVLFLLHTIVCSFNKLYYICNIISQREKELVGRITVIAAFFMPCCQCTIEVSSHNIFHFLHHQH